MNELKDNKRVIPVGDFCQTPHGADCSHLERLDVDVYCHFLMRSLCQAKTEHQPVAKQCGVGQDEKNK